MSDLQSSALPAELSKGARHQAAGTFLFLETTQHDTETHKMRPSGLVGSPFEESVQVPFQCSLSAVSSKYSFE